MSIASITESVPVNKIPKIDHDKVEQVKVKKINNSNDIILDLPIDEIPKDKLPAITIITVTRNRKHFFPLAIDNWKRVYYPHDNIFWLIVDDSDDITQGPIDQLKSLNDNRILYYYLKPNIIDGKTICHSVGYKRNLAMTLIKTDYAAMIDDDDYIYAESIISRICCLMFYDKQCIYSDNIGVFNAKHENSYILEGFSDVPEGTLLMTKKFWNKNKFGEAKGIGEGIQLVSGQELNMLRIPYYFNLIVINHKSNLTGGARVMRFNMKGKMKQKASMLAPINFFKLFPTSFSDILKTLM